MRREEALLVVLFQVRSVRPGRTYIIAASRRREASETCDITLSPLQPCTSIDQITAVSRSDVHSPKLHDPFFSFLFFADSLKKKGPKGDLLDDIPEQFNNNNKY